MDTPIVPIEDFEEGYIVRPKLNEVIRRVNALPEPINVLDTTEIDMTIASQQISSVIKPGSISESKLDPALVQKINVGPPGTGTVESVTATAPITITGSQNVNPIVGINPATTTTAGSMSAADKVKLGTAVQPTVTLAASIDLNTVVTSGFYRIANIPVNGPVAGASVAEAQFIVSRGGNTITQMLFEYQTGKAWTRSGSPTQVGGTGSYSPWMLLTGQAADNFTGDVDTIQQTGFYAINPASTNQPAGTTSGFMVVVRFSANAWTQEFTNTSTSATKTWRRVYNGAWGAWGLVADPSGTLKVLQANDTAEIGLTLTTSNALTADLNVDSVGTTKLVPAIRASLGKADSSVQPTIGLPASADLNTVVTTGFYRVNATPVNSPTGTSGQSSQMIVSRASNTIGQLFMDWSTGRFFSRAGSPTEVGGIGVWPDWMEITGQPVTNFSGNVDTIKRTGFYGIESASTNQPTAATSGFMTVIRFSAGAFTQEFTNTAQTAPRTWRRVYNSAVWGPWVEVGGSSGGGGIADAPNDAFHYGRNALAWSKVLPQLNPVVAGSIDFTASGARFFADFSGANHAQRLTFMDHTANTGTSVGAAPNGTATSSSYNAVNKSGVNDCGVAQLACNSLGVDLVSGILGAGAYIPLRIWTGGLERMRVDAAGLVSIGPLISAGQNLLVSSATNTSATAVTSANTGSATVSAVKSDFFGLRHVTYGAGFVGTTAFDVAPGGSASICDSGDYAVGTAGNKAYYACTNNTMRMVITGPGSVGFGRIPSARSFEVEGDSNFFSHMAMVGDGKAFDMSFNSANSFASLRWKEAGTLRGSITHFGSGSGSYPNTMLLDSGGYVFTVGGTKRFGIGTIGVDITGGLFMSAGGRYFGDFSNATVLNRSLFQTSTVNGSTYITAIPNGTANGSGFHAFGAADPANASSLALTVVNGLFTTIASGAAGTGVQLPLSFVVNGSDRMQISTAGHVGIGIAPVNGVRLAIKCHAGSGFDQAFAIQNSAGLGLFSVGYNGALITGTDTNSPYNATTTLAPNVYIDANGQMKRSTFVVSSSLRYKEEVEDYSKGIEDVCKLRPVTFKVKGSEDGKVHAGLIAEEVEAAGLSEFVHHDEFGKPDNLHYPHMISLLVNAVKELTQRVADLEKQLG